MTNYANNDENEGFSLTGEAFFHACPRNIKYFGGFFHENILIFIRLFSIVEKGI